MNYIELYSELGKLLYAVADIDGVISKKEKLKLLDIVKKELEVSEKQKDEFGTNLAYYTETEFEFLEEEITDAESAFESFINFVEDNNSLFDSRIRSLIVRVANEIALAYHGKNLKEEALIKRLRNCMQLVPKK